MAARKKRPVGPKPVEAITHDEKRVNIPTADAQDFVDDTTRRPVHVSYPRDTTLDPQLVWKGKDAQDNDALDVEAPPIYIQEKVDPRVLIENLRRTALRPESEPELALFEQFDGLDGMDSIEFYRHAANWSNRLILGDSLQVMASLAERENMRGQVQMIYMDPPYGIKFGSNWQVSTQKREVKERLEDATREVEQIKAFRDTWELGIHSYLSYLRDRFIVARDLLTESGSIFVQMGSENVHLIRALMDEVLGAENFGAMISVRKTFTPSAFLDDAFFYVLWYAKSLPAAKYRQLWREREAGDWLKNTPGGSWGIELDGVRRATLPGEKSDPRRIPDGAEIYALSKLTSAGASSNSQVLEWQGKTFRPGPNAHWKTTIEGLARLGWANRLESRGGPPWFVRFHKDFPAVPITNLFDDTAGKSAESVYVVQTQPDVIQRCMLMTTDPGDVVIDPTCGSGTTAMVAEEFGRRWITVDTSRVALTIARQRIMGARFPQYLLADSAEGLEKEYELTGQAQIGKSTDRDVRKGFVYKRIPHITLKAIANNSAIVEGMSPSEIDAAIAMNADTEILYDQPYEDSKKVRVAGPFTVESLSPHRAVGFERGAPVSEKAADTESTSPFEQMLLENLRRAGVQNGRRAERFEFSNIEVVPGKYLVARASPIGPLADERVAVSIGPRYGTVGPDWIKAAAREAMKGAGNDVLLVLGFAFDPRALETVDEFLTDGNGFEVQAEHRAGGIRVLLVRMNADLAMGESLLKKTKAANLFTVFGEPDIEEPRWTSDGWVVSIRGFDVYNPLTGEVRAGAEDEIAMWMIDTDYNEESFFVRHAYFLGSDPYGKLKKALKADIDADSWESLNSATSRPFAQPSTGKIAIKVINHYGDELLSVIELQNPTE